MKSALCVAAFLMASVSLGAETTETRFIADTLVIQAEGSYEADPDLATMSFQVFSQEKELSKAYAAAAQSMQRIADLAQKNDLSKGDIVTGVLTVSPFMKESAKSGHAPIPCKVRSSSAFTTSQRSVRFSKVQLKTR